MKGKILHTLVLILALVLSTNIANSYSADGFISSFVNSPSASEIESIEDKIQRVCEQVFLEAYMRRDFSERENMLCSDIFEMKIEAEMSYKYQVLGERGIY